MQGFKLPQKINDVISSLNEGGFDAYAVGGCVRDMILGKTPNDYDITTNASPEEIKEVFKHLKTIDTGIKHGTVTVIKDGIHVEVTTYRIDGEYKDNRRPESVTFSKKLADDLSRRDFTVNALAFNESDGLTDCFGGLNDIENKIIRCVGEPERRFNEDALRILRALRFSSVLGYKLEENTSKAVLDYAYLLKNISKERIFTETKKLVCGENSENVLLKYRSVIELIFPVLNSLSGEEYGICSKMASVVNGDAILKLTALLFFVPHEDAAASFKNLKSDNASSSRVRSILSCAGDKEICSEKDALVCLNMHGEYIFDYIYLKSLCCKLRENIKEEDKALKELEFLKNALKSQKPYKISHLDINGKDLMQNGTAYGSDIGKCLNALLFAVIDGRVKNVKKDLLEFLKI